MARLNLLSGVHCRRMELAVGYFITFLLFYSPLFSPLVVSFSTSAFFFLLSAFESSLSRSFEFGGGTETPSLARANHIDSPISLEFLSVFLLFRRGRLS